MAFYLQLLLLLPTIWQLAFASTCIPPAPSCAAILEASSASCSSFFSSNKISTSTCTSTSTITPATVTKTVTSVSTETDSTSVTDTRTIQQTKARSSTITTTTLIITSSTTTSTTTSEVVTTTTTTVPAAATKKRWIDRFFKRAPPVIPDDCSCFLTSTATKLTTAKTPTTTSILPVETAKTITSTIKTTITISNVGTTLTSISTSFTTYTSTYTSTDSLTSTSTATCPLSVDFLFDSSNCGSCGNVCSTGTACYNGVCAITCATSALCGIVTCGRGGDCLCNAIAEGGIVCFEFATFACDYPSCSTSTDCPIGQGCVTDTCCSIPFCVPINTCSNSASPKYLFKKTPTDASGDVSHYVGGGS